MKEQSLSAEALARQYFDAAYYLEQTGGAGRADPFAHYLSEGAPSGVNPCKFFEQEWYGWQNPAFAKSHDNAFFHYLEIGRHRNYDPSPLVDMVRLDQCLGLGLTNAELSDLVLRCKAPVGCGVYASFDDLAARQKGFYEAIRPVGIRTALPPQKRRNLIIVQAGTGGLHHTWFDRDGERNWDICINLYDATDKRLAGAEYIIAQTGTKATAMSLYSTMFRNVIQDYEYILFLDDDITVEMSTLNRLFETCFENKLDAAQMSLSKRSRCVWPLFFSKEAGGVRYTNGVEIMMPVLSGRCFAACHDLFGQSVSGFGLDLAIGKRAAELGTRNVAVLDNCVAEHLRSIDTSGGAFYSYLRSVGINPKAELWQMKTAYDTPRSFEELQQ